jgi:AP-1 complex subunit beta-1
MNKITFFIISIKDECTEWGQVFILDYLANYQPKDEREAQKLLLTRKLYIQITIIYTLVYVNVSAQDWRMPMLLLCCPRSKC